MSHLGALITPLVDGELSPARAAQARGHLQVCAQCRQAVAREEFARRRTREAAQGVEAGPELTARLLAMPAHGVGSGPAAVPGPRRTPFVLGGGVALVGLFVLTLFVLGSPHDEQTPSALLEAAEPGDDVAATAYPVAVTTAVQHTWAVPTTLPVSRVDLLDDGATETLDVTVVVPEGEVRLLERPGRFADDVGPSTTTVAGHPVHEVDGWYVLESGDCVVAVHGEDPAAVRAVIAALPPAEAHGVLDRIAAGWQVLAG